jgi:hypothetical protein
MGPASQTILKERPLVSCVELRTYANLTPEFVTSEFRQYRKSRVIRGGLCKWEF